MKTLQESIMDNEQEVNSKMSLRALAEDIEDSLHILLKLPNTHSMGAKLIFNNIAEKFKLAGLVERDWICHVEPLSNISDSAYYLAMTDKHNNNIIEVSVYSNRTNARVAIDYGHSSKDYCKKFDKFMKFMKVDTVEDYDGNKLKVYQVSK